MKHRCRNAAVQWSSKFQIYFTPTYFMSKIKHHFWILSQRLWYL